MHWPRRPCKTLFKDKASIHMMFKKKTSWTSFKGFGNLKVPCSYNPALSQKDTKTKDPSILFYTLANIVDLFLIQCTLVGFSPWDEAGFQGFKPWGRGCLTTCHYWVYTSSRKFNSYIRYNFQSIETLLILISFLGDWPCFYRCALKTIKKSFQCWNTANLRGFPIGWERCTRLKGFYLFLVCSSRGKHVE